MSFYDLAMVWRHSPATGNALLVHLALADMAIDGLVCASQGEIAILARCDVSTVSRRIADLVGIGELVEESRGAGRRTPIFRIAHKAMTEGAPPVVVQNAGVVQDAVLTPDERPQVEQGDVMPEYLPLPPEERYLRGAALIDDAMRSMRDVTGIADASTPPPPVNVHKHLARAIVGRDELVKGLEALLRTVGAQLPEGAPPLYWYRDEHVEAYRGTLDLAGMSPSELLTAVQAAKIKAPNMRRVQDLHDTLAAAQILPF